MAQFPYVTHRVVRASLDRRRPPSFLTYYFPAIHVVCLFRYITSVYHLNFSGMTLITVYDNYKMYGCTYYFALSLVIDFLLPSPSPLPMWQKLITAGMRNVVTQAGVEIAYYTP